MKTITFWSVLTFVLLLSACGGDGGGDGGGITSAPTSNNKKKEPPPEEREKTPWERAGAGALVESEVSDQFRVLEFDDGMAISYDGSDSSGDEEICRREVHGDTFYEVCMPLEDDPYFVVLENNAFVWHPLMFDRFATELVCRFWEEGENKVRRDCMAEVFPAMGGDGFYCEAGLVNGDKALRCSDQWGVSVNGEDHESKTVCRVLLSDGSGHCLGAPSEGDEDADLILEMQKTTWAGYRSAHDNEGQFAQGAMASPLAPQDLPEGAQLTYWSGDEDICTVENSVMGGGVMILPGVTAPTVCKIYLKIEAEGFADRVLFVELPVLKPNDTTWGRYRRPSNYFYPGETLGAQTPASTDPATTDNEYTSLDETICTVDKDSGSVTAVAAGECAIRLTARAEGYLDVVIEHAFPVDEVRQFVSTIAWSDFDALSATSALVGTTQTLADPTVTDGAMSVEHVSGDCAYAFDGTDHTVTFHDATECVLMVAATGSRGSQRVSREFRFTPGAGTFTLAWAGYANSNAATYGSNPPATEAATTTPADLGVTYVFIATGGGCEVDAATGALTIVGATDGTALTCEVTLTASRSGYTDASAPAVTVAIAKKAQTGLTFPSGDEGDPVNLYAGVAIPIGATAEVVNVPMGGVGSLEYRLDSSPSCDIDGMTGVVTVKGTASDGSVCSIEVRWSGDDNHAPSSWSNDSEITVEVNSQSQPSWNSDPYGAAPSVVVGATETIDTAPSGGAGAVQYRSTTLDICTVNFDTGAVTGVGAGTCTLEFRYWGNSSTATSPWSAGLDITVTAAEHPTLVDDSSYYGVGAQVDKGGELELVAPPVGFGAATYSVTDTSICSVDASSGTVTGIETGDCTVQVAFAGDNQYGPLAVTDLQTLPVGGRTLSLTWNPYKEGVEYRADGEGMIGVVDVGESAAAVVYEVVDAGETGCFFKGSSGDARLTLSFTSHGICTLRATARARYYDDWVAERILRIRPGTIAITVGAFAANTSLKVGADAAAPTGTGTPTPSSATVSWELVRGERDCTLENAQTGAVKAVAMDISAPPQECSVQLVARASGYDTYRSEPVSIPLGLGEMGALTQPDYNQLYSNVLPLGGTVDMVSAPTEANGLEVVVTGFAASGFESDGLTAASDVCTVDATSGRVTAGSSAVIGYKCEVTATMSATGYQDKTVSVTLTMITGGLSFATAPTLAYTGELKFGGTTELAADTSGLPAANDNTNAVAWIYRVEGSCEVDNAGQVSITADTAAGDECAVRAIGVSRNFEDVITAPVVLTVAAGDLAFTSATKASYSGDLRLGGELAATIPDNAADDNSVPVTWGAWRVEGYETGGTTAKADVCEVDAEGLLEVGSAAVAGDVCKVFATATAPNYNDSAEFEVGSVSVAAKATFGTIAGPVYSDELTLRGDAIDVTTAPTVSPSVDGVSWTYRAEGVRSGVVTADICSVDAASGAVTPGTAAMPADTCKIYARAEALGFETKEGATPTELTLKEFFTSLVWAGFPSEVQPRASINLSTKQPTSVPAYTSVNINVTSSDCAYSNSDVLSFSGLSECVVVVTASKDGYLPIERTFRVTPASGPIEVSNWGSYAAVTVGTTATAPSLTYTAPAGGAGVSSAYATATDSSGCTVSSTGVVSGTATTTSCKVERTLTAPSYSSIKHTYTISVGKGTQTGLASWTNPYGTASPSVETGSTIRPVNPPTGKGAIEYRIGSGGSHCSLVPTSGAVTGDGVGSCTVQARFAGNVDYNPSDYGDIATIAVTKATQADLAWSGHPYGTASPSVAYHATLPISTAEPTGQGAVEYRVATGSASYCSVDAGDGTVTPLLAGVGNTCEVQARFSGNTNYRASGYVTIATVTITRASLGTITWGAFPASTTLVVGSSGVAPTVTTHAGATVSYAVAGSTSANCELLDETTGAVWASAVDLTTTEQCTLDITVSREGYITQTHQITIDLAAGIQRGIAWNPGSTSFQTSDASAALGVVTGADSADSITYAVTNAGDTNCAFSTGTDSTLTFNAAGICQVQATVARTGYSDWTSAVLDIEVTALNPVNITWSGYSDTNILELGDATPLTVTVDPSGATKSFSVVAVPTNACTIDTTDGTLTAAAAGTCYITLSATASGGTRAVGKKIVAVTVEVLDAFDFATAGVPTYGDTELALGFQLDVENLSRADDNLNRVAWTFAATGTRRGVPQSGVCSVENSLGRVSAGADAQLGDVCTVTIAGGAYGFADYRQDIALRLRHPHPLQVATNRNYSSCVLFEGGQVKCWGANSNGELGIGNSNVRKIYIGDADGEMGDALPYLNVGTGRKSGAKSHWEMSTPVPSWTMEKSNVGGTVSMGNLGTEIVAV